MINERDLLGSSLIRRNDEITLLFEKINIQNVILQKGEIQYSERVEDIRVLKIEVKRQRAKLQQLGRHVEVYDDMK